MQPGIPAFLPSFSAAIPASTTLQKMDFRTENLSLKSSATQPVSCQRLTLRTQNAPFFRTVHRQSVARDFSIVLV